MEISIVTQGDLENFKEELFQKLDTISEELLQSKPRKENEKIWLKSHNVQRMLNISPGTLQNLRINGTIPYSKVGGVIFYEKEDILKVMEENKRNAL